VTYNCQEERAKFEEILVYFLGRGVFVKLLNLHDLEQLILTRPNALGLVKLIQPQFSGPGVMSTIDEPGMF
jgi:hypothetical protein